jgi:hypothetical protein
VVWWWWWWCGLVCRGVAWCGVRFVSVLGFLTWCTLSRWSLPISFTIFCLLGSRGKLYSGLVDCAVKTVKGEGVTAIYKGETSVTYTSDARPNTRMERGICGRIPLAISTNPNCCNLPFRKFRKSTTLARAN